MRCAIDISRAAWRGLWLAAMLLLGLHTAQAAAPDDAGLPDDALRTLLAQARVEVPRNCAHPADRLEKIFCQNTIRIGVRNNYPLFGTADGEKRAGFEIDIARSIASRLGVNLLLVSVSPATRSALLAEDRIDLTVATMGHTTLRDGQARFIRPHYYASRSLIVGANAVDVHNFDAVAGRTICATVGNSSNAELSAHGARLMLFDSPDQLVERLRSDSCSLVAQDDSYFARSFAEPDFAAAYEPKFDFAPLPWGMAVSPQNTDELAAALSLISQIMHRDGVFLSMATKAHVATGFLAGQRETWGRPECNRADGFRNPNCILQPLATEVPSTPFAGDVTAFESWLGRNFDVHPSLVVFKIAPAWDLVRKGAVNSLVLVAGTLACTFGFALMFGRALSSRIWYVHIPARAVLVTLQSSPVVLSLVVAAAVANAMFTFSTLTSLIASMIALGLLNGGNAGQAISEAVASLRAEEAELPVGAPLRTDHHVFLHALRRAITQIGAFLINATKGTPAASLVGTPELLNALTDSSAFSSDRATTYWLLLIFYTLTVLAVVQLCVLLRRAIERRTVAI